MDDGAVRMFRRCGAGGLRTRFGRGIFPAAGSLPATRRKSLDDYRRAMDELLPTVSTSVAAHRARVEEMFLKRSADRFVPVPG